MARALLLLLFATAACSSLLRTEGPIASKGPDGRVRLRVSGAPAKGDPSAPLVVVEFVDFQCPVSGRHLIEIMPGLEEAYVQTGNVRYVALDFPLPSHPRAIPAAVAARCAGQQGKFWEMHDRLLSHQRALDDGALKAHAEALGLDIASFSECSKARESLDDVAEDVAAGAASGVRGTPTFLIGLPVPGEEGTIEVADRIPGVGSYPGFAMVLERVLRTHEPSAR